MLDAVIAWCEPGEPPRVSSLLAHSVNTTAIADLFYERWRWRAAASGLPDSLLLVTAALHDMGKAWKGYQNAAKAYCRDGRKPSFLFHEILSGAVIAAMASLAAAGYPQSMEEEAWEAMIMGVILHHHGMTKRYDRGVVQIIYDILENDNLCKYWRAKNWCKEKLAVSTLVGDALPVTREILERLQCLADKLDRNYDQQLIEELVELVSNARALSLDDYIVVRRLERAIKLPITSPRQAEKTATIAALAGFTAVADSATASIERAPSKTATPPKGTYAWRVLREAYGGKAEQLVQDRLEKAGECLSQGDGAI